jgi:hypothetical protein
MNKADAIVCVAGWEERFAEGVIRDLSAFRPDKVVMLIFSEFAVVTATNRESVRKVAAERGCAWEEVILRREPKETWTTLRKYFTGEAWKRRSMLLDITTMPRETIWWTLGALVENECRVEFVYHQARSYSQEWLTRDTDEPRLLYQYSGISKLGKPTCLLLLNGFDTDRALQIIQYFEPALILLGIQVGTQFGNEEKNALPGERIRQQMRAVKTFNVNAYSPDFGYADILQAVLSSLEKFNIVAASLGPKTSAIALFRLVQQHPEIALAYAPSREFNMEYSEGIGASLGGSLG